MNILGTEYKFGYNTPLLQGAGADGICRKYEKLIVVREVADMLTDSDNLKAKTDRYNEVCRHEVIHAFFDEAGLDTYSVDETLVGFLATNIPKMIEIFRENGWLG